jgi:hypothetical protein
MGPLDPGSYRKLTPAEMDALMRETATGEDA